ncbi:STAS domain-containing protein [Asanoa sp. WMMD1127]|nr:STAS domain-containing protein [Asanoa sp. WMMD1127]MDG4826943.1 STAS domain-containing protein [Asanoa sp. WMMD1127]
MPATPEFAREVFVAVEELTARQLLIIDLRELDGLPSEGERVLGEAAELCEAHGVECYLVVRPDDFPAVRNGVGDNQAARVIANNGRRDRPSTEDRSPPPRGDRASFFLQQRRSADGDVRLLVFGEIDVDTAGELALVLHDAVMRRTARAVTVDLGGVTFLDSAGVRALLHAHALAAAGGIAVRVVHPGQSVSKALRITGVHALLTEPDPGTTD